jgi:hypothetical protein
LLSAVPPVVSSLAGQARSLAGRLPEQVRTELTGTVSRLGSARSPQQLSSALEAELARLLSVAVPVLARAPFPVRSPAAARLVVAGVAGTAGAVQQVDTLEALRRSARLASLPRWLSGSVGAPAALGSLALAWIVEVWATVAVRTRQLEKAGRTPDPDRLAEEVARAVMGSFNPVVPRPVAVSVGRELSRRFSRRLGVGLVPVLGAVYEAVDAQSTIAAVLRIPVDEHPSRAGSISDPTAV